MPGDIGVGSTVLPGQPPAGSLDASNPGTINTSTVPIASKTGIVDSLAQSGAQIGSLTWIGDYWYAFLLAGIVIVVLLVWVL